ncbi:MAG: prepilin-type N-terminal cleavage/methylation domain-containing protein [Bdellovibrionota bacterium]
MRRQRGFTLAEVLISVAVGGLVIVAALMVFSTVFGQNTFFARAVDVEIDEVRAANAMSLAFAQAIAMTNAGAVDLNAYVSAVGAGRLRSFDSDAVFGAVPSVHTLAVFWREARPSTDGSTVGVSTQLKKTALYFQKPTPTTWGVLYLDLGGTGTLGPTRDDSIFEGFTRLRILNVTTNDATNGPGSNVGSPVTSFDVEMTFRRFIAEGDATTAKIYCPESALATLPVCAGIEGYKDVVRTIKVTLRDNVIALSPSSPNPAAPRGARLFDLIHFFQPRFDGGLR